MPTEPFIEIRWSDGSRCVVETKEDVEMMTIDSDLGEFSVWNIEMTREEYEALPDFES